jgi:hypothetical protein
MAIVTGSLATYNVTTNREDLIDAVYRISPVDTPLISAVPRAKAPAVLHEWSTQALATINTTNARLEGDALTRVTSTAPVRRQNYCQISSKDATVTGTQRATNPAGIDDMMAYQSSLKSLELKRDMEAILLGNAGQNAGNTTTARTLRSFNSWFSGNALRGGSTAADATAATAAALDATAGGVRTLTEVLLKQAILAAYTDGGEPNMVLCGPFNKQIISGFTGRATSQQIVDQNMILGAASLYASDFGTMKIVPNRSQRERDVFVIDPTKVAVAYLRAFEPQELGRVGDAVTRDIISEYTLEMRHPDAHAAILDCTTS